MVRPIPASAPVIKATGAVIISPFDFREVPDRWQRKGMWERRCHVLLFTARELSDVASAVSSDAINIAAPIRNSRRWLPPVPLNNAEKAYAATANGGGRDDASTCPGDVLAGSIVGYYLMHSRKDQRTIPGANVPMNMVRAPSVMRLSVTYKAAITTAMPAKLAAAK